MRPDTDLTRRISYRSPRALMQTMPHFQGLHHFQLLQLAGGQSGCEISYFVNHEVFRDGYQPLQQLLRFLDVFPLFEGFHERFIRNVIGIYGGIGVPPKHSVNCVKDDLVIRVENESTHFLFTFVVSFYESPI